MILRVKRAASVLAVISATLCVLWFLVIDKSNSIHAYYSMAREGPHYSIGKDGPPTNDIKSAATAVPQYEVYTRRREALVATCRRLGYPEVKPLSSDPHIPKNLLVEANHSILYCPITKVGSTFWLRTLSVMTRDGALTSPFQLTRTQKGLVPYNKFSKKLPSPELNNFLKGATSFLFTRDPYQRLFSAYLNKLYNANWLYWRSIGRSVVKAVRHSPSNSTNYGDDVTFPELVKYILMLNDNGKPIDPHFKLMHKMCNPCNVSYDFIGHLETFKDDAQYLLSEWKRKFTNVYVSFDDFEKETHMDLARGYFNILFNAYNHVKSPDYPLHILLLRMWKDLHIRGVISKSISMPLSENDSVNITRERFLKLIEHALDDPANRNRRNVALQRQEALVEAYRSVPADDMERLRQFVAPDCNLFGYDGKPAIFFNRTVERSDNGYSYFTSNMKP